MRRSSLLALALVAVAAQAAPRRPDAPARADGVHGKQVFDQWCAPCHARGPGHPGTQSLAIRFRGATPAALEDRTDLTPEVTAAFVRNGVALMPFFRKTEVSDRDLRDLSAYLAKGKAR